MAKAAAKTAKKKTFKKKEKKVVPVGVVHIQATFNNTIVTRHRPGGQRGRLVERRSVGFPRLAQGDPVRGAAGLADRGQQGPREAGMRTVEVRVSGPGAGRESAIRAWPRPA
jgi:small subunit ribosomal protein S11